MGAFTRRWLAAAVGVAGLWAGTASAAAKSPTFGNAAGLHVLTTQWLDPRLAALTVRTPALPAVMHVRILLPAGYAERPRRRYPVLYLLHGTSGTASDWTAKGGAEQLTDGLPLIVVMPDIAIDDGGGGWCTNWPNGTQNWETFHIDELLPWVRANLRTLNARGERAIAGLSQGGFCSMSYAAQYPNLFGVALAYSGVPDIAYDPSDRAGALAIINATEVGLDGVPPDSMFGNPISDYLNYADHDPATLAENLRFTKMYLYFGNGHPGPLDTGPPNLAAEGIEGLVYRDNIDFHTRLDALGIRPAVYDPYGNGTHSWPYWERDLRWSLPLIMADFAARSRDPASFAYTTARTRYALYGWTVTMHRLAAEFSTLTARGRSGFTLAGSGSATVRTPARYSPRHSYVVTIRSRAGVGVLHLRPVHGRLTIDVPLGPSDTQQEYSAGGPPAPSPGTTVEQTSVTIRRAPPRRRAH